MLEKCSSFKARSLSSSGVNIPLRLIIFRNGCPKAVRDAVEAKVQELEERKKSDKCCNYLVYERDGEYVLDFLVSDGADGKLNCVEVDIHHYKPVTVNGKKAVQLNFYSRRAYGDDIIPFMESLKDKKDDWITELTQMKIVCKMK